MVILFWSSIRVMSSLGKVKGKRQKGKNKNKKTNCTAKNREPNSTQYIEQVRTDTKHKETKCKTTNRVQYSETKRKQPTCCPGCREEMGQKDMETKGLAGAQ